MATDIRRSRTDGDVVERVADVVDRLGDLQSQRSDADIATQVRSLDLDDGADERPTSGTGRRVALIVGGIALLGLLGAGGVTLFGKMNGDVPPNLITKPVTKGKLVVMVTGKGTLESASNVDIKCEVAGGSKILWIVEDGKKVKKGDKLVELDKALLDDQINAQRIAYNKAKSARETAQKDYNIAKVALRQYEEGTYKQELQTLEAQVIIAEENLTSAQNALMHSNRMFRKGYISELQRQAQQFAVRRSELEKETAEIGVKVLKEFTYARMVEEYTSQLTAAKIKLESEQAAFDLEESRLTRLEKQLGKCELYAPKDGMVVYANQRGRRGSQNVQIELHATVSEQQDIIRLPDLSKMQAKVMVSETKVERLEEGMDAVIKLAQGRNFFGKVTSIANQPEQRNWFEAGVQEYPVIVEIEDLEAELKPGMTANTEITVEALEDVLMVPVTAVIRKKYCWVKKGTKIEQRTLVIGTTNDSFYEVKDGVAEGEEIVTNPRTAIPEARKAEEAADQNKGKAAKRKSKKSKPSAAGGAQEPSGTWDWRKGDKDGDGKLSRDEASDRLKPAFDKYDKNADGFLDEQEINAMRAAMRKKHAGGGAAGAAKKKP